MVHSTDYRPRPGGKNSAASSSTGTSRWCRESLTGRSGDLRDLGSGGRASFSVIHDRIRQRLRVEQPLRYGHTHSRGRPPGSFDEDAGSVFQPKPPPSVPPDRWLSSVDDGSPSPCVPAGAGSTFSNLVLGPLGPVVRVGEACCGLFRTATSTTYARRGRFFHGHLYLPDGAAWASKPSCTMGVSTPTSACSRPSFACRSCSSTSEPRRPDDCALDLGGMVGTPRSSAH